jgi:methylated-DNA-[protein]-cysteine S-methyltransferase
LRCNLVARLQGYFAGAEDSFDDVELDLEYETPFLERCAFALREVPRGEVVTYGELAALAGAPGAARAAGSFCARNRLGLFVPCHRVVAAGGLGSYGSFGVEYKRRLLALEGYVDAV